MKKVSGKNLLEKCRSQNKSIAKITIDEDKGDLDTTMAQMNKSLDVMIESVNRGRAEKLISASGISGGNAYIYNQNIKNTISGDLISKAISMALSCSEVNASMGRIVACPTAGSCGILPACVISVGEVYNKSREEMVMALFTAAGVGNIIANNATMAGAEGGCQAECGSAAAMSAAAIVELMGGTPEQALTAGAISLKNILGLVCDPVGGLVEIPCVKRNAAGTVNAITSADMALLGVESYIPFDDAVIAMYEIGLAMNEKYRETALGGLAITETGKILNNKVYGK